MHDCLLFERTLPVHFDMFFNGISSNSRYILTMTICAVRHKPKLGTSLMITPI